MKTAGVERNESCKIIVILPVDMRLALDAAVEQENSDISKFTRKAIKERLAKFNLPARKFSL